MFPIYCINSSTISTPWLSSILNNHAPLKQHIITIRASAAWYNQKSKGGGESRNGEHGNCSVVHSRVLLWTICSAIWELPIEPFYSRGQWLCTFVETKASFYLKKGRNPHRIGLGHQHGRRLVVLFGGGDVMCNKGTFCRQDAVGGYIWTWLYYAYVRFVAPAGISPRRRNPEEAL